MADEADFASNAEQYHRDKAMAELAATQLALKGPSPREDGLCYWCNDADVLPGSAFCSADCRDDHAAFAKQRDRGFVG